MTENDNGQPSKPNLAITTRGQRPDPPARPVMPAALPGDLMEITDAVALASYRTSLIARLIARGELRAWVSIAELLQPYRAQLKQPRRAS